MAGKDKTLESTYQNKLGYVRNRIPCPAQGKVTLRKQSEDSSAVKWPAQIAVMRYHERIQHRDR